MNEWESRLLANWDCSYVGDVSVKLEFRLSKTGEPYDIKLRHGFGNPFAIRSALHAVLFAMPFHATTLTERDQALLYQCTICGDSKSPNIKVELLETYTLHKQIAIDELNAIPSKQNYYPSMFAGYKLKRLARLFEILFKYPDVLEIVDEISSLAHMIELDCAVAHDWVAMSRSCRPRVKIMRHPESKVERIAKAAIAPLLQSYRIEQNRAVLYELEDGYAKLLAIQTLAASKADPLLLGAAALLIDNEVEARKQLAYAAREGEEDASPILAQMTAAVDQSKLKQISLTDSKRPSKDRNGWKQVRYWFPTDTELCLVGNPSTQPVPRTSNNIIFGNLVVRNEDPNGILEPEQLRTNRLFENQSVAFAMHAARAQDFAGGLGGGTAQSANVLLLGEDSTNVAAKVIDNCRDRSLFNQVIEGVEVLTFDKAPFTFAVMGGNQKYLCTPTDGVILSATSMTFLREIIQTMRNSSESCAFRDDLPEWNCVDKTADIWAIRHYDTSFVPFNGAGMYDIICALRDSSRLSKDDANAPDEWVTEGMEKNMEIGFAFSRTGKKWMLNYLSRNQKTLRGLLYAWDYAFNYDYEKNEVTEAKRKKNGFRSEISESMLAIEATPEQEGFESIQLWLALGYFVSI